MERHRAVATIVLGVGLSLAPGTTMAAMGYSGTGSAPGRANMGSSMQLDDYFQGMRAMHAGKYAEAIPHLERAYAADPHNAEIMCQLGVANVMLGNDQLAYGWLQKALVEDPDHKGAHETLGVAISSATIRRARKVSSPSLSACVRTRVGSANGLPR